MRTFLLTSLIISLSLTACSNDSKKVTPESDINQKQNQEGTVIYMTSAEFKSKIFDFTKNQEWNYTGNTPVIIDFYADWCRPCKMVAPIMDELAKEYKGKITIYKINTDKEADLSTAFGIRSIPTMLFIPVNGTPQMTSGAYSKAEYIDMINKIFYNLQNNK